MDKKDLEILQQYIFDIEALVNVTCDSCEHNLYTPGFASHNLLSGFRCLYLRGNKPQPVKSYVHFRCRLAVPLAV